MKETILLCKIVIVTCQKNKVHTCTKTVSAAATFLFLVFICFKDVNVHGKMENRDDEVKNIIIMPTINEQSR